MKKIAVIGGGGKITTAAVAEMLYRDHETAYTFSLFGRNQTKIAGALGLLARFNTGNAVFEVASALEDALTGADAVLYCASYGLGDFESYRAFGVQNGAFIMGIGERMAKICPEAWLLVVTNPPDIPLTAVSLRFGLKKVIGLCNASTFTRKVLAAFLDEAEEDVMPMDVGVNHELWYYDVLLRGKSVYDDLKKMLAENYDPETLVDDFHDQFPEWREGFRNSIEIMKAVGYLPGPVGGGHRFKGLPQTQMSKLMKRPTNEDFAALYRDAPALSLERILSATRRCAAEFPIYIADILRAVLTYPAAHQSALVLNNGAVPCFPDEAMIQLTCSFDPGGITKPEFEIPEFIRTSLSSRVGQNLLLAKALAYQDDLLLRQAAMVYPERMDFSTLGDAEKPGFNAEPWMSLN